MSKRIDIRKILSYLDCNKESYIFEGNREGYINGFSSYGNYKQGNLTWIKNYNAIEKNRNIQKVTLAVVQNGVETLTVENKIIVKESKRVFFDLLEHFFSTEKTQERIGNNTYLSPDVKLGKNVVIGHNCTLDGMITIGDGTRIYNNINIINNVTIGQNCEIQSGVNIGHDGFGYTENEEHQKTMVKHYGGVVIEDNVYIGGNSYIERGTIDNTIIKAGVKIDGACVIVHNCIIEKNTAMVGGSTLLGSVHLKDNVYIASALIKNQVTIGKNAVVGMGSVVIKDVEADTTVIGVPAQKLRKK